MLAPPPRRATRRPDGTLELVPSLLQTPFLEQFLVAAAACHQERKVVFAVIGRPVREVAEAVQAAISRIVPSISPRVSEAPAEDGRPLSWIEVTSLDPDREVPFLSAEGSGDGQRDLVDGAVRLVPRSVSEARLRRAGLAEDELAPSGLGLADLDSRWAPRPRASRRELTTLADAVAVGVSAQALAVVPRLRLREFAAALEPSRCRGAKPVRVFDRDATLLSVAPLVAELCRPLPRPRRARELLREALTNAIVHRSYAPDHLKMPIYVDLFADALVIRSPGPPLARVALDGATGPEGAFARNPQLQSWARRLGLAKAVGFGARLLRRRSRSSGFRPVQFSAEADDVSVTLAVDPEVYLDGVGDRPVASAPTEGKPGTSRAKGIRLPPSVRDAQVLAGIGEYGPISAAMLARRLGASAPTVRVSLNRLVAQGKVRPTGDRKKSPKRKYVLVRRPS